MARQISPRLRGLLAVTALALLVSAYLKASAHENGLKILPESERGYRRLILGLDPNETKFFMLPSTESFDPKSTDPRVRLLRRQLYWINFELLHGDILRAVPSYTRFFVAVPDPRFHPASMGNEQEVFEDYLQTRIGWTAQQIRDRVFTFKTPVAIAFAQDLAEPLGLDARGRLVLALGEDSDTIYQEGLGALVKAFPNDFALRTLSGINTEGGDIEIVWLPDLRPALLVGHHRILRTIERKTGINYQGRPMPDAQIAAARSSFKNAFFGLETIIVNEGGLRSPTLTSDDLFHSDMIVNIVRGKTGPVAFIPSFEKGVVDATTLTPVSPEVVARAQRVYDRVAGELSRRGYAIARLPLVDHPTRNPVNVGKFVDPSGQQHVLLGKYPFHLPYKGRNAQKELQEALDQLDRSVNTWRQNASDQNWRAVTGTLGSMWLQFDRAASSPNPNFDAQARIYESHGVRPIAVPIYPTGEGGLHCLALTSGRPASGVAAPGNFLRTSSGRQP